MYTNWLLREKVLQELTNLFESMQNECSGTWHVYFLNGKLLVGPHGSGRYYPSSIMTLTTREFKEGLTEEQWNALIKKTMKVYEDHEKCQSKSQQ